MANDWQTIKENLKYSDSRFKIYENDVITPDDKSLKLKKISITPGVHIVALTPDRKIPLVKQYRYPAGDYSIEIPSGGVDVTSETFMQAGKRELQEETGYIAEDLQFVGRLSHNPSLDFIYEIYFAKNIKLADQKLDASECGTEVILLSYEECLDRISSGAIKDSSTIACLAFCHQKNLI